MVHCSLSLSLMLILVSFVIVFFSLVHADSSFFGNSFFPLFLIFFCVVVVCDNVHDGHLLIVLNDVVMVGHHCGIV